MLVPLFFVDVFAPRKFSGNQLCVVPDPGELSPEQMQVIAREIGFSETTFVTQAGGDRYAMRIFTPDEELPFAGHPTLGTAFVLVSEGRVTSPATQVVAAGELPAEVVSTGLGPLLAPVRDLDALRLAERDARAVREVLRSSGGDVLYLFCVTDEGVTARMFDGGVGIGEDPATGSSAGPLGAYLASRGVAMPGKIIVSQGEQVGRPSFLHVEVTPDGDSWAVEVGGGVVRVGQGVFDLS